MASSIRIRNINYLKCYYSTIFDAICRINYLGGQEKIGLSLRMTRQIFLKSFCSFVKESFNNFIQFARKFIYRMPVKKLKKNIDPIKTNSMQNIYVTAALLNGYGPVSSVQEFQLIQSISPHPSKVAMTNNVGIASVMLLKLCL